MSRRGTNQTHWPIVLGGFAVLAILAAGLAFILGLSDNESVVIGERTTYREGLAGTWERINPLYASSNEVDDDLASLIFSALVRTSPDGGVEPDLADLPRISEDGREYTFTLQPGATWQDGQPLTSSDVAFTIARLADPDFRGDPALSEAWSGVEVETPDAQTVVFRLRSASAPFLARTATVAILPEHLLLGLNAAALYDAPFNTRPIGSGPYRLESLDAAKAVLVANDRYHRGKPAIARLEFIFYTDYPSAIRGLSGREIDGLMVRDALAESQLAELDRIKGMKLERYTRAAYLVLYLNNDQATFADVNVRTAIGLTIDRRSLATRAFAGLGLVSSSPIPPGTWSYAKQYDTVGANRAEARRLLDEAQWVADPNTGVRVKDGAEFRFTIRTDNDAARVAVATEIAQQLESIGIRTTVQSTTFAVLRRDFLQERRYEAAVAGWDQGADPDPYFAWHSSQGGAAGLNLANFEDVVVDELIAKARVTVDSEVRQDLYRQFQEKWQDLEPSVVLLYPQFVYVHVDGLKGPQAGVLSRAADRFSAIEEWTR